METLKTQWKILAGQYSTNHKLIEKHWLEIQDYYSGKNRHYHNLNHVADLLRQATHFKLSLNDPDLLAFSIWYHDIIYSATKKDNEVRSAKMAQERLGELGLSQQKIQACYQQIMLTKNHLSISQDHDEQLLLDFDLAVLGREWSAYEIYKNNVRKEYRVYPDFLYKPGRKKALLKFLERTTIYHTVHYLENYEMQARENLRQEIGLL